MTGVRESMLISTDNLTITIDVWGNLEITRKDCGGSIELSVTEWTLLDRIVNLRVPAVKPPYHGQDDKGYED